MINHTSQKQMGGKCSFWHLEKTIPASLCETPLPAEKRITGKVLFTSSSSESESWIIPFSVFRMQLTIIFIIKKTYSSVFMSV